MKEEDATKWTECYKFNEPLYPNEEGKERFIDGVTATKELVT